MISSIIWVFQKAESYLKYCVFEHHPIKLYGAYLALTCHHSFMGHCAAYHCCGVEGPIGHSDGGQGEIKLDRPIGSELFARVLVEVVVGGGTEEGLNRLDVIRYSRNDEYSK